MVKTTNRMLWTVGLAGTALVALVPQQAQAFTLGSSWQVVRDSAGLDGTYAWGLSATKSPYEIWGMAMKVEGGRVFVAINGNLPRLGTFDSSYNTTIGWGDLLFNPSTNAGLHGANNLIGVRFSPNSNSGAIGGLGVYNNVTAGRFTTSNSSATHHVFGSYVSQVESRGGVVQYGDLSKAEAENYLTLPGNPPSGQSEFYNMIGSGTKIGDIQLLSASDLAGINWGVLPTTNQIYSNNTANAQGIIGSNYQGISNSNIFGFSFDAALLGEFEGTASLLLECNNDGIAARVEAVPEPTTMAGLAIVGGALAYIRRRRRNGAAS